MHVPGIFNCRPGKSSVGCAIPIELVNTLFFIRNSNDACFDDAARKHNAWILAQRCVGFVPLPCVRKMVSCCHGLEHLNAVPFPSNYIDPFSRARKATQMDKPGPFEK